MKKFFTVVIILSGALWACGSVQEGKNLFVAKCAQCHELQLSFKETKNLSEWKKIARRMARYSDGFITTKEADKIAAYLTKRG